MKFATLVLALSACTGQIVTQKPVAPAAPQVTVTLAAQATFRINLQELDGDEWSTVNSGTAWVAYNGSVSYLVTAGHVCHAEPEERYTLTAPSGLEYTGITVDHVHSEYDLCLVSASAIIGPALPLAPNGPRYDQPVAGVGAPLGVFGCDESACGMAPISRGFYAGGTLVSMPMAGGNSGSAVFTQDGVIGVLVAGYPKFTNLSYIEPLDHLRDFLD